MDLRGPVPKGRAYRSNRPSRNLIVGVIVCANLIVGGLLYLRHIGRLAGPASAASLEAERDSLLKRVEAWNVKARGLSAANLPALTVSSQAAGGLPVSISQPGGSNAVTGTALNSDYCDPEDPHPEFHMRPAEDVAKENPELAQLLKQHAKNNEIMLTLANGIMICKNTTICWWGGGNILESFLTILQYNNITNYLIGVMDDETEVYLSKKEPPVNWFRVNIKIPESQKGSHPANQVSTIKYTLLKTFLQLRYHVLITDMDLVYMKNPFDHLHRDADIEIQTDGYDETAYGVIDSIHDPTMGWGGGGLYLRTFTTNVGCMWVKANARSFKLMQQVSDHLASQPGWDQQIFNQYLMRPSHGKFQNSYAHLRVMDIDLWLNSKIFFRSRRSRYLPGAKATMPTPILVHMNYHPDKHKRMLCLMDRYLYGKVSACDDMPGGSNPGT